jgi:hypothetical protein
VKCVCPDKNTFTRNFSEVYLAEIYFVKKRREKMKITADALETESKVPQKDEVPTKIAGKEEITQPPKGMLGFFDQFKYWFLFGLAALLIVTTLLRVLYPDISTIWGWFHISIAWILWGIIFLDFQLQPLFLETTKPPKSPEPTKPQCLIKPNTKMGLVGWVW